MTPITITLIKVIIVGFLVSKIGTYITIKIANHLQFFEKTNFRKTHEEKVSALGGIPIFLALWLGMFILPTPTNTLLSIGLATFILVLVGLWDDFKNISVNIRLLAQIAASSLAFFAGFYIDLGHDILNYCSTVFFVVLMINSVNFIDGINGLAGGLGAIVFSIFAILFYTAGIPHLALFCIAYVSVLLGFLTFNFGKKAAIFMGDNGSTVLGFLIAIFAIKSLNGLPDNAYPSTLATVLSIVAIPIFDLFAVVIIRLSKGQSPFVGDRNHIHHLLTDSGMSHPEACRFVFIWTLSLFSIFYFNVITSPIVACLVIIGAYVAVRIRYFQGTKSAILSLAKLDKPVPQPVPVRKSNTTWALLRSFLF